MSSSTTALHRAVVVSLLFAAGCGGGDVTAQQTTDQAERQDVSAMVTAADTTTATALSRTFRAAANKALPSVVTVQVTAQPQGNATRLPFPFGGRDPGAEAPPQIGTGSGFVLTRDGYIVTNNHVVENATNVQVRFVDGRVYDNVEVVGRDPDTDVAVIKIDPRSDDELTPMEVGDSDALQVGDWVLALGNPLSLGFTVTAGIVSAKGRSINIIPGQTALEAFIQTDAAINRGNSGGPLVDLYGRVVGVNTAISSPTGTYAGNGFAVPSALAVKNARDIIEYGYVRRPRLGVVVQTVTEAHADLYDLDEIRGAYITEVAPDGPADNAGLEAEDIILSLDGDPVATHTELTTRLARMQPGDNVTLGIFRNGRYVNIDMELGQFDTRQPETRTASNEPSAEELLGISVVPTSELSRQQLRSLDLRDNDVGGVVVVEVSRFGPAAAQLGQGDIIFEMNREPVNNVRDLRRVASDVERGDVVLFRIRRASTGNQGVVSFRVR